MRAQLFEIQVYTKNKKEWRFWKIIYVLIYFMQLFADISSSRPSSFWTVQFTPTPDFKSKF